LIWGITPSDKEYGQRQEQFRFHLILPVDLHSTERKGRELNAPAQRHREAPFTKCAKPRPMGREPGRSCEKKIRGFLCDLTSLR
jgi:hypothetical protein